MTPDPFVHDDAAYVLGALSEDERVAFEEHLAGCADCRARVDELMDVPALLGGITEADLRVGDDSAAAGPVPDAVFRNLARAASAQRRRRLTVTGALAAVAAACVIALAVVLWPSSATTAPQRAFSAVSASPVRATAALVAKPWGTAIDLHCRYAPGTVDHAYRYALVVYDRQGRAYRAGDWTLPATGSIEFPTGTALPADRIARLEITLPDGTPLLRLRT